MITHEELIKMLDYNQYTGKFKWLVNRGNGVKIGDEAGCFDHVSGGYLKLQINGKQYHGHRLAWLYMTGSFPVDEVDHINGIPSDNKWSNLRECNRSQNQMNQKKNSNNTSGYKNISLDQVKRKTGVINNYWRCCIMANGKSYRKMFPYTNEGLTQAIEYRDRMLKEIHGEYSSIHRDTKLPY